MTRVALIKMLLHLFEQFFITINSSRTLLPELSRMAAPQPRQRVIPPHRMRLAHLRHQYALARHRHNVVLAALVAEEARVARLERRRRRWWVRPWLLRRPAYGQFENLMVELEREHHGDFKGYLRMEPDMFHELVQRVGPRIRKSME